MAAWRHIAFGWNAPDGTLRAYGDGLLMAELTDLEFEMPGLPASFGLGAAGAAVDEFRLYRKMLAAEAIRTLPGFGR